MGHRVVKRVPMDFDAPLNKVWKGYLMPEELGLPTCPDCNGDGYSAGARVIHDSFYAFGAEHLAWRDKLGQDEVDNLVEEGRLRKLVTVPEDQQCGEPCDDAPDSAVWKGEPCARFQGHDGSHHPRASEWMKVSRTAEEVNAANRPGARGLDLDHDAINRWILVKFRCKRLGIPVNCARCEGNGDIGTPEQRAAVENWEGYDPPEGAGWQLWTTTTEGSPIGPVFATAEELAEWAAHNATVFASITATKQEWLASFQAGTTDVDSLLVQVGGSAPTVPMRNV